MAQLLRIAALALSFLFPAAALAQTVTMQGGINGYGGAADAGLNCCGDTPMGGANDMEIRNETSDAMVLRFAIFQSEGGPVPNGVAITSATLSVYKYAGPDGQ